MLFVVLWRIGMRSSALRRLRVLIWLNASIRIEKPIAATLAEADELVSLAAREKRVLQVGHVQRFSGAFQALARRVDRALYIDAERLAGFKQRGAEVDVPTLRGRKTLRVPAGTKHGTVQRLRGEGPPRLGKNAKPSHGDIHYRFLIDIPAQLSDEQSELIDKLSATMNGTDPRASLFAASPAAAATDAAA